MSEENKENREFNEQPTIMVPTDDLDKVSEEDKHAFCTISGIGVLIIGIGLVITSMIIGMTDSELSFIAFGIGFVIGLAMLIYAGSKYN